MKPVRGRLRLLLAIAWLAVIPACGDDPPPTTIPDEGTCPPTRDFRGGFEGTVTAAGNPYPAQFEADNRDLGGSGVRVVVTTRTDSLGSYRLILPQGRYSIRCRFDDGSLKPIDSSGRFATGSVTATIPDSLPLHADHAFPSEVRILVHAPPEWEGKSLKLLCDPDTVNPIGDQTQVTDGMAIFRVVGLPAGTYRFGLDGGHGLRLSLPPRLPERSDFVEVPATGLVTREFLVPSPCLLRVVMTGSAALTGRGLAVTGYDQDSILVLPLQVHREYEWTVYTPVHGLRLRVGVEPAGRWYGGDTFEDATRIDLEPGADVTVEYFECGIAGTFRPDGTDGREWILLEAYRDDGRFCGGSRTLGNDGAFYIGNLEPGSYLLHVEAAQPWPAHWYEAALAFRDATPIRVDPEHILATVAIDSVPPPRVGGAR